MPEPPCNADPVPGTPIGDMTDWQLHVHCGRCRHHVVLPLDDLASHYGRRTRVVNVIERLRCGGFRGEGRCRGRPRLVMLVKVATYGKATRKLRQIVVLDSSQSGRLPPAAGDRLVLWPLHATRSPTFPADRGTAARV
jgi:hypothetical protein